MIAVSLILSTLLHQTNGGFLYEEQIPWPESKNLLTDLQNITVMGEYTVIFDNVDCELRINHTSSATEIYRAQAAEIVQTGTGDIDLKAELVIQDGNLAYKPKADKFSKGVFCPTYSAQSVGSAEQNQQIVQLDGETEANLGTWWSPLYVKVPTRARVYLAEDNIGVVIEA